MSSNYDKYLKILQTNNNSVSHSRSNSSTQQPIQIFNNGTMQQQPVPASLGIQSTMPLRTSAGSPAKILKEEMTRQSQKDQIDTLISTVALLMDRIDQVQDQQKQSQSFEIQQTRLISDDKMVIQGHDRTLRELQDKVHHMPQKVDFMNFKHDFEKMRDEFVYLKSDYEYKLDSSGVGGGGQFDSLSGTFMNTIKTDMTKQTKKNSGNSLNVFHYIDDQLQNYEQIRINKNKQEEMALTFRDAIQNCEQNLRENFEHQLTIKTNGLGEEIASDVNSIEGKIKDLTNELGQYKDLSKRAMFVLERKFDKCAPKEPKSKSKNRKASSTRNRSRSGKIVFEENQSEQNETFNSAKVLETLSQKLEVQLGYMKKEIMQCASKTMDLKLQNKKALDEIKQVYRDNDKVRGKLNGQDRLLHKIRDTQFIGHQKKTSVKHRERTYVTKVEFRNFHIKLRDSFLMVIKMLKDSFKRDSILMDCGIKGHYHPSGAGLMCKTDLHNYMKTYYKDICLKGFIKVDLPIYKIEEDEALAVMDFSGSEKEWMENHVKFEEKKAKKKNHSRSRSVRVRESRKASEEKNNKDLESLEKVRHQKNQSVTNISIKLNKSEQQAARKKQRAANASMATTAGGLTTLQEQISSVQQQNTKNTIDNTFSQGRPSNAFQVEQPDQSKYSYILDNMRQDQNTIVSNMLDNFDEDEMDSDSIEDAM